MKELKQKDVVAVLKALDERWALVDEKDEDDFVTLVNESRDEMENFILKKEFIRKMVQFGFIKDPEKDTRPDKREMGTHYEKDKSDVEWIAVTTPNPVIYFYEITSKGRDLLNSEDANYKNV